MSSPSQGSSVWRLTALLSADLSSRTPEQSSAVAKLADELAECWRRGERLRAEDFLDRRPELWGQPEAALALVYEEICLRQEHGEQGAAEAVAARFPQWRAQLQMLLQCHQLLDAGRRPAAPPAVGDTLGGFRLVAELGRGAVGGVFLALESNLADRPVVLKVTPRAGNEHLSLARLQHTHIVPLYSAFDDEQRDLRVLCMPYFGGASLARIQQLVADVPPGQRTGRQLVEALDQVQADSPIPAPVPGPSRDSLARASYAQAVCWVGACLADALHYAHQRGLVHLDLKPANVLLAADGTPMLLDFHLAREPLRAGAAAGRIGGTPLFMAPEQAQAVNALRQGRPVPATVDGRADVFALGLMLYHALGGPIPVDLDAPAPLDRHNPQVSVGLGDLLRRCLARDPQARYPDAGALADDLRRHLADRPLRGVPNRSLAERWAKWRRRQPHGFVVVGTVLAVVAAATVAAGHVRHRYREPHEALRAGQELVRQEQHGRALEVLEHGRRLAAALPFTGEVRQALDEQLEAARAGEARARRRQQARELHELAERIRFASVADPLPAEQARALEAPCRALWEARERILGGPDAPEELRADLLDVAVIGASLRVRLAPPEEGAAARREAIRVLDEAAALLGPSPTLELERAALGDEVRLDRVEPRTAWEHVTAGRTLLQAGRPEDAVRHFVSAIDRDPGRFWPHFYLGLCAYRLGRGEEAVREFSVCAALSPGTAACYYNRALARLQARPPEHAEAVRDLQLALERGADPAAVHYQTALIRLAEKDRDAARASLRRALEHAPDHVEARTLLDRLGQGP